MRKIYAYIKHDILNNQHILLIRDNETEQQLVYKKDSCLAKQSPFEIDLKEIKDFIENIEE